MHVLIVDDDPHTRELLARGLREELFRVDAVADGLAAEEQAATNSFDAIVLDVILPGHDGFAVCRRIRSRGVDTPILMLTGRHRVDDRVRGLDAGADDYLAKPFAFLELVARLRAVTRRGRTRNLCAVLTYGPIEFDQRYRAVKVSGTAIELSPTELRLLEYLVLHAERVVKRDELAEHIWGRAADGRSNIIEVYISYLRKKLSAAAPLVRTVRGLGYTLSKGPL